MEYLLRAPSHSIDLYQLRVKQGLRDYSMMVLQNLSSFMCFHSLWNNKFRLPPPKQKLHDFTYCCVFFSSEQKPVILWLPFPANFSLDILKENESVEFIGQNPINLSKIQLPSFHEYIPRKWAINKVVIIAEAISDLPEECLPSQQRKSSYDWREMLPKIIMYTGFISYSIREITF